MSKWFGEIGYKTTVETDPGIWEESLLKISTYGDLITDRRKHLSSDKVNDDISISNILSILANPLIVQNCSNLVYAEIMGIKWKVLDVEILYPRLRLTLGGKYNE